MIRKLNITDLDRIMEIWLDSNIDAPLRKQTN